MKMDFNLVTKSSTEQNLPVSPEISDILVISQGE